MVNTQIIHNFYCDCSDTIAVFVLRPVRGICAADKDPFTRKRDATNIARNISEVRVE